MTTLRLSCVSGKARTFNSYESHEGEAPDLTVQASSTSSVESSMPLPLVATSPLAKRETCMALANPLAYSLPTSSRPARV